MRTKLRGSAPQSTPCWKPGDAQLPVESLEPHVVEPDSGELDVQDDSPRGSRTHPRRETRGPHPGLHRGTRCGESSPRRGDSPFPGWRRGPGGSSSERRSWRQSEVGVRSRRAMDEILLPDPGFPTAVPINSSPCPRTPRRSRCPLRPGRPTSNPAPPGSAEPSAAARARPAAALYIASASLWLAVVRRSVAVLIAAASFSLRTFLVSASASSISFASASPTLLRCSFSIFSTL